MTLLKHDRYQSHTAELCPVHWRDDNWAETLDEETGLVAIATVRSRDGALCNIPCHLKQVQPLAREISLLTPTPLASVECMPRFLETRSELDDWEIGNPDGVDEGDIDLTWLTTPMPPAHFGTVLDIDGHSKEVVLLPRLVLFTDVHHQPMRHWFYGANALAEVVSVSYVAAGKVRCLGEKPRRELTMNWAGCDAGPPDCDGLVKHEADNDDGPILPGFPELCHNQEFAAVLVCEQIGKGNNEWPMRQARARKRGEALKGRWDFLDKEATDGPAEPDSDAGNSDRSSSVAEVEEDW